MRCSTSFLQCGWPDLSPYSAVVDFAVTPKLSIDIDSKPFRKLLLRSKPRKHHASDRSLR
ncbi:Os06g0497101 [Oryza sativa Japonica Group]|uniref:Os06g0497101 protein n=1 Tax=Oryza sativa subsp. japonica TaxID=39947 RepID=C7J3H7_ORYSJ|nr:Os06g0497101 [Oryza sativa Japonica Group]|eukprot:NP_001174803.1 Os06g0497101 [Oryza sativa Japonica Group]